VKPQCAACNSRGKKTHCAINRTSIIVILSLLAALGVSIWQVTRKPASQSSLLVFCAAGLREPVSEIASRYEREFGIPVDLQFGGSGALEAQLELAGGDLFFPADESYIQSAQTKGLVDDVFPVTTLTAGIVVPKGNPKNIRTLADLGQEGVRLSMADRSAAIGRLVWPMLDLQARIASNVVVTKPTVNNVVEDVATGAVDATLAWDAVALTFAGVEWIPMGEGPALSVTTSLCVLTSAKNREQALHFAKFLTASKLW
jgi:molybdate transport system substrate-binding protein